MGRNDRKQEVAVGLRRKLLSEAEVFDVAEVCEGVSEELGVTSTVLCAVAEEALKSFGAWGQISNPTMRRLLREWELSLRRSAFALANATPFDVANAARQTLC